MTTKLINKLFNTLMVFAVIGFASSLVWITLIIGYVSGLGAHETPTDTTEVTWVYDTDAVNQEFKDYKEYAGVRPVGLADVYIDDISDEHNYCIVHAKQPRSDRDFLRLYILGHEMYHCFVGNFHK